MAVINPAKTEVPTVEVTAIAARDVARARSFAKKHGIPRVFDTYDQLIHDADIDAIYIGLPNSHHCEWTIKALQAGKHVLCEKPISNNAQEAETMAVAAEKSGKVLMEAFHYRYHPLIQRVRELILTNAMESPLRHVHVKFAFAVFSSNDIRWQYDLGGGSMMDTGCYTANCVRYLIGEELDIVSATATPLRKDGRVDQSMRAELQTTSGSSVTALIETSMWSLIPRISIDIRGANGQAQITATNWLAPHVVYNNVTLKTASGKKTSESFTKARSTYGLMLEAFADATLNNNRAAILTDAHDAVLNMRLIDSIYTSAGMSIRESRAEK
ncbi:oxidoreductase domain-containing protein, variant [Capsaspora owczarzaki ATCC 30864]|uniref:D-xylose 1-dehydrogenase (NADP(+), D-xylono-1,5-lactone-forming) n=2 Tax=Capsaspora owczarzaki (strain ATCC 30864) TaxID=595528 RepID=A0A0D2UGQ7_CAPO3|nr:oxidoreductase domain-containing protein, variant [Capsaspora owczarzaki ATCC 30864]